MKVAQQLSSADKMSCSDWDGTFVNITMATPALVEEYVNKCLLVPPPNNFLRCENQWMWECMKYFVHWKITSLKRELIKNAFLYINSTLDQIITVLDGPTPRKINCSTDMSLLGYLLDILQVSQLWVKSVVIRFH